MSSAGKLLIASALAAVFATACTSTQIAPVSDNSTTGTIKSGPASVPAAPAASSSGAQVVPLSGGSGFSGGSAMSSAAPAASGNTYTVKAGDTLYRIAKNHGVNVNELMRVNGISDPRQLAVGRTLQIPGAGRPAVRVATAPGRRSSGSADNRSRLSGGRREAAGGSRWCCGPCGGAGSHGSCTDPDSRHSGDALLACDG